MDKRVVFAVAGSGKTSSIIDSLNINSKCLIVTYTDNNTRHLKNRVTKKLGIIPSGIRIYSYFTFLYSFCFKPICGCDITTKGINFNFPLPQYSQRAKKIAMNIILIIMTEFMLADLQNYSLSLMSYLA